LTSGKHVAIAIILGAICIYIAYHVGFSTGKAAGLDAVDEFRFYYTPIKRGPGRSSPFELELFLKDIEWVAEYREDVFDCSEMSAFLERALENDGWRTTILVGPNPAKTNDEQHAWLLVVVFVEDAWIQIPVETTGEIHIVRPESPFYANYFEYDYVLQNIYEAVAFDDKEFDWWA
jgi:hypothetical protein